CRLGPKRWGSAGGSGASVPGDEVGEQLEPGAVTFLRMELHSKDISLRYCASKRRRIIAGARHEPRVGRRRVIAVREIKPRHIGDTRPERMRSRLPHRAPSHVRYLEPTPRRRSHLLVAKPDDAPRHD